MNAELMIDEVLDIVDDPSYDREDDVLKYLNYAQVLAASKMLMPGLADGFSEVSTVADQHSVIAPTDYMRKLHAASVGGSPVRLCRNFADISQRYEGLSVEAGPVEAVVIFASQVYYQKVPAVPVDIELRYYRVPTPMEDKLTSFPDGLGAMKEHMDTLSQACIHFAASKLYAKIEQGLEGKKIDTEHHLGMFQGILDDLDTLIAPDRVHPAPPVCEVNW